jgi:hypothetical protein
MYACIHTYIYTQELAQAERLYDQGKVDIAMAEFERFLEIAYTYIHTYMYIHNIYVCMYTYIHTYTHRS